jgi:hypothetical protein
VRSEEVAGADSPLARASMQLEHSRAQFVGSMRALEAEVTRSLDWRQWVRRKPAVVLALAFGVGLFLGCRTVTARRSGDLRGQPMV